MSARPLFLIALAASLGCAVKAYTGARKPPADVCVIEGMDKRTVSSLDGKPTAQTGLMKDNPAEVEALPGRHTVVWASTGKAKPVTIAFRCKGGHRYRLKKGEVEDAMYGSRTLHMVEDAETLEVMAAEK
ncbi:MAG: hypothetical protein AAB339_12160 [Elusimicrobiota bacterium]